MLASWRLPPAQRAPSQNDASVAAAGVTEPCLPLPTQEPRSHCTTTSLHAQHRAVFVFEFAAIVHHAESWYLDGHKTCRCDGGYRSEVLETNVPLEQSAQNISAVKKRRIQVDAACTAENVAERQMSPSLRLHAGSCVKSVSSEGAPCAGAAAPPPRLPRPCTPPVMPTSARPSVTSCEPPLALSAASSARQCLCGRACRTSTST